ncbi:MAG: M56 family metallopeptidase, partial [Bacteroidota bacterium]
MTGHIICWSLISAFSFFRNVFVSNQGIEAKQYEIIIEHEKEHVRCRHSFDVVFFELMFILNWYNPLFYFYRHLLQESHEFEVDNKLLNSGVSLEHYLQAMFSASFNGSTALLVNRFFSHPLKRRISMLQRSWKEEWSDFRIVYGIPFLLVVFISLVFSTDATKVSGFESQQIFGGNSRSGLPFENPIPPEHNPVITSGYGERIHPIKKVQAMH